MTHEERLAELRDLRAQAINSASERALAIHRGQGKMTARERIDKLLDPGSFEELDTFVRHQSREFGMDAKRPWGDAVVTGYGTVEGRTVFVFSQEVTTFGGSLGQAMAGKICKVMDLAASVGAPIVGINDSGGARIQEGVASLSAFATVGERNVRYSGVVPQLSLVMGPCAGGSVYSPAGTDFIFMVKGTSYMFITGPDVIRAVTGEEVEFEELGGAETHSTKTGVAHLAAEDEESCLEDARYLLSFLPSSNREGPPRVTPSDDPEREDPELDTLLPENSSAPYDMRDVIERVFDDSEFFELHENFARNLLTGFARLDGWSVGIVANQPAHLGGVLDIDSSEKMARFVSTCDTFNVPLIFLTDAPGVLPGLDQEWNGIIRRGAKPIYTAAEATVPRIDLVTRKAYGGSYAIMGAKHFLTDLNFAWPSAEIAVMGAEGAAGVLFRREIAEADDPEQRREELIEEYKARFLNPYSAAEWGYVDDVIEPRQTRPKLIRAMRLLRSKRVVNQQKRKHGNMPL